MNFIDKIRNDVKKRFNEDTLQKTDFETSISPSGNFRLEATTFSITGSNREITQMEIYRHQSNEKIFDFLIHEGRYFYGWVRTDNIEYLISAEDILGGQSILDLTNLQFEGYSPDDDGFIWTDFFLSPDGETLATLGCYWACNSVIKLFDFSNPMLLPLKEINEIKLLDNDEIILGWLDNETLKMRGIKRERELEYSENGSFRMKTLSEVKVEREININLHK